MREIAIVASRDNERTNAIETIDAIKRAGFQNVFLQWYNAVWKVSQEEQLKYAREQGLNVIFAHLGYKNINELWREGEAGDQLAEGYKQDIKVCKENNIPMVILHLTSKTTAPPYGEIGLKRIQEIVDYAESLGIKVAFENNRMKGYLDYVIEHVDNENAGVCFDAGHYHAFFHDDFDFSKFKDRIIAVHLHDNDESDDQHLIPFDGTNDWDKIIEKLVECNYDGPITMEQCYRNQYLEDGIDHFYQRSYEAGKQLVKMFEEKRK